MQAARDGYPAGAADDAADQRGEEQGGRPGEAACQPSHDEADQREPCGDAVQVVLQRPRAYGQPGQEAEGGADGGNDGHGAGKGNI